MVDKREDSLASRDRMVDKREDSLASRDNFC